MCWCYTQSVSLAPCGHGCARQSTCNVIPHEGPELISGQNTLSQSADSRAGNVIMRYRLLDACLFSVFCLIGAHHAWADTMRCGDRVIADGESMATVRAFCGPPTVVQHSVKVSATTTPAEDATNSQSHTVGAAVPVETWTYDRGPNMFMVNIRFVDGTVVAITTLHEYGH